MISESSVTINAETVALPTGFLQIRDFFITEGGTKHSLTFMTPSQMDQIKGSSTSGMPEVYTILGDNFRFAPIPSGSAIQIMDGGAKFVLQSGDALKVQSNTASSLDVWCSVVDAIS